MGRVTVLRGLLTVIDVGGGRWLDPAFAADVADEHATSSPELDSAIGDADHGVNLDRGLTAVVAALDGSRPTRRPASC